ncbi:MAG TPA: serine/threonine-protein kinase [Anaeromyxobacter sp.]|nr:serine/threonine-protein kinase [Anaeromyxobacter sp.]
MQDPQVGETLDRFQLIELLAQGGMASIFRARDLDSGEEAVLKIPYMQYESDVVFHQRFLREEEIGQRIRHPGIVRVLPAPERSRLYLAMEYVPGRSLAEVMAGERPLATERALSIASQLCDALACLRVNGVVHRDVKPSNVRVLPSGAVKLLDFGIALDEAARRLTWSGLSHAVGTPDYMAPEQIRGRRGDARTDVYALGTLLYEMLTGHLPFEPGSTTALLHAKLHGEPTPPSVHRPGLDPALEAIVMRAIAREPRRRYAGAAEMLAHLRAPAEALVPPPLAPAPRTPGQQRRRAVAALLFLCAVAAGLTTLVFLS